jgi:hypothetical protein
MVPNQPPGPATRVEFGFTCVRIPQMMKMDPTNVSDKMRKTYGPLTVETNFRDHYATLKK